VKTALIIVGALVALALLWFVVLPQLGMGAQAAAWKAYKRKKEAEGEAGERGKEKRP